VGAPTCLRKQEVGKPSQNAAQLCAKAEGCVHDDLRADKLWKSWGFWVGTWNVNSLTGRAGELVETLADREVDVECIQETRWRGSGCRFFGAQGKRYKLFFEHRIRQQIEVDDMQFGFMKGKGTTDAIFIVRQMQENFRVKGKKLYFGFVDLEKAFDRVSKEVIQWAMHKLGVEE